MAESMTDRNEINRPGGGKESNCCGACEKRLAGCFGLLKALIGLRNKELAKEQSSSPAKVVEKQTGSCKAEQQIESCVTSQTVSKKEDKEDIVNRQVPEGKEIESHLKNVENDNQAHDFDLNSWLNMNRAEVSSEIMLNSATKENTGMMLN